MKFNIVKQVKLDFLGEGWDECYLKFSALSYADLEELSKIGEIKTNEEGIEASKRAIKLLEDSFLEGKALSTENKIVSVKKSDLRDFPVEVISRAVTEVAQVDPNAPRRSST